MEFTVQTDQAKILKDGALAKALHGWSGGGMI